VPQHVLRSRSRTGARHQGSLTCDANSSRSIFPTPSPHQFSWRVVPPCVRASFGEGDWFFLEPSPACVSKDCAVEELHALPYEEALFGAPDKPNCTRIARSTCRMSCAETLAMRLMSRLLLTVVS
jgi:hypothetical protein